MSTISVLRNNPYYTDNGISACRFSYVSFFPLPHPETIRNLPLTFANNLTWKVFTTTLENFKFLKVTFASFPFPSPHLCFSGRQLCSPTSHIGDYRFSVPRPLQLTISFAKQPPIHVLRLSDSCSLKHDLTMRQNNLSYSLSPSLDVSAGMLKIISQFQRMYIWFTPFPFKKTYTYNFYFLFLHLLV